MKTGTRLGRERGGSLRAVFLHSAKPKLREVRQDKRQKHQAAEAEMRRDIRGAIERKETLVIIMIFSA